MLRSRASEICPSPSWVTPIGQSLVMYKLTSSLIGLHLGMVSDALIGAVVFKSALGSNHHMDAWGLVGFIAGTPVGFVVGFVLGDLIGNAVDRAHQKNLPSAGLENTALEYESPEAAYRRKAKRIQAATLCGCVLFWLTPFLFEKGMDMLLSQETRWLFLAISVICVLAPLWCFFCGILWDRLLEWKERPRR